MKEGKEKKERRYRKGGSRIGRGKRTDKEGKKAEGNRKEGGSKKGRKTTIRIE